MADDTRYLNWLDELIADAKTIPNKATHEGPDIDSVAYRAWRTRAEHFLLELLDAEHVYYTRFNSAAESMYGKWASARDAALAILVALRDDLAKGRLISFRAFVTAEVFSDFLDMAEHLLEHGYKDPAASLIGAVLERGLRDIAAARDIAIRSGDDLTAMAQRLSAKGVYNALALKKLSLWIGIRNHADHGHFGQYSADDVRDMHSGVSTFLAQYSPQ